MEVGIKDSQYILYPGPLFNNPIVDIPYRPSGMQAIRLNLPGTVGNNSFPTMGWGGGVQHLFAL